MTSYIALHIIKSNNKSSLAFGDMQVYQRICGGAFIFVSKSRTDFFVKLIALQKYLAHYGYLKKSIGEAIDNIEDKCGRRYSVTGKFFCLALREGRVHDGAGYEREHLGEVENTLPGGIDGGRKSEHGGAADGGAGPPG